VAIASAFLLALLFSFLIVFDLPGLTEQVRSLEQTRLKFIYEEVADGIYNFSRVLGQAFEAQFFIALMNTLLTAIGIFIIGLGNHVAFLSMIVFLCSFVPVVGVFISSAPICLIALQLMGLKTMFFAIILIIVIHLIEGYILNPRIYGSRMRINPVIVLFILTIAGKLFHIWGLVLGVPVFSYISGHAIQLQTDKNKEKI
jgi:predicted PurR-regulated permease PerM